MEPFERSGLLVRDVMSVGVETCRVDTSVLEILKRMMDQDLDAIVVMDEGNAVGVIEQTDLIRAFTKDDWERFTAEQVMDEDLHSIPSDIPVMAAAQLMVDKGVRTMFITHHAGGIEYAAAVVTLWHILRLMVARTQEDVADLGIGAARKTPLDTFFQRRDAARKAASRGNH